MNYPSPNEYAPYYHTYVGKIDPQTDLISLLKSQFEASALLLSGLTEAQELFRYAPGKWSIRELLGHMTDGERVFAYRAMRIARGDSTPLPGFEQDDYVAVANFDRRSAASLLAEWRGLREATIALAEGLNEEAEARMGVASDNPVSVRALLYIIAGHEKHHMEILRERYLV
ncbi:MAG: DinB family protein [Bacteroidia bacterium]